MQQLTAEQAQQRTNDATKEINAIFERLEDAGISIIGIQTHENHRSDGTAMLRITICGGLFDFEPQQPCKEITLGGHKLVRKTIAPLDGCKGCITKPGSKTCSAIHDLAGEDCGNDVWVEIEVAK